MCWRRVCDGPAGETALSEYGEIPPTVTALTGRGRHLYFAHPGQRVSNSTSKLGPMIDVRGDGGYVIAPPSRHPSGRVYAWAQGLSLSDLAPAPFPDGMRHRLTELTRLDPAPTDGPSTASEALHAIVMRSGTLAMAVDSTDCRVQAYLHHVGHRAEGSRNASAFQVAAFLVRDFGLSARVASAYLAEWNAGNHPPLGAGELRDVLASAIKHGRRTVGCAHQTSQPGARA